MAAAPGQTSGQDSGRAFDWGEFVDGIVRERGSLAAAADHLAQRRGYSEDAESVERGLRRLRARGSEDGGVWGQRALQCFGLPATVGARIRWMGQYHSRFTDLPASVCDELLRPWDRPPVSESPARIWVLLGHAGLAIRRREDPAPLLAQAGLLQSQAEPAARIELALVSAYAHGRSDPDQAQASLTRAGELLQAAEDSAISKDDRACLFARYVDQLAYPLNKPRPSSGAQPDHQAAIELYKRIADDGPPFAQCRRHNGLGWSYLKLDQAQLALEHANASVKAAGDSGSLRMRAMALNLLAAASEGEASALALARAQAIAARLEDEALAMRFRPR